VILLQQSRFVKGMCIGCIVTSIPLSSIFLINGDLIKKIQALINYAHENIKNLHWIIDLNT
jgi:hypothetical protein